MKLFSAIASSLDKKEEKEEGTTPTSKTVDDFAAVGDSAASTAPVSKGGSAEGDNIEPAGATSTLDLSPPPTADTTSAASACDGAALTPAISDTTKIENDANVDEVTKESDLVGDAASEGVVGEGADKRIKALKTTSDSTERKLDGETRLATQQINHVLEKTRTREEMEAENRKLRSDLTIMRRRLNIAQDCLNTVRTTVNKFVEDIPADLKVVWRATESKIAASQINLEKEIAASGATNEQINGGASAGNRRNRQRNQRQQSWKQKTRKGGKSDSKSGDGQDGDESTPNEGKRRRGGSMQSAVPAPRQETADQINNAERVRDELRAAKNPAEIEAAIVNAKAQNMKYEVDLATKKLEKLQNSSAAKNILPINTSSATTTKLSSPVEPTAPPAVPPVAAPPAACP